MQLGKEAWWVNHPPFSPRPNLFDRTAHDPVDLVTSGKMKRDEVDWLNDELDELAREYGPKEGDIDVDTGKPKMSVLTERTKQVFSTQTTFANFYQLKASPWGTLEFPRRVCAFSRVSPWGT